MAADDHRRRQAAVVTGASESPGVQPRLTEQIASRRWSAGSCCVLSWRTASLFRPSTGAARCPSGRCAGGLRPTVREAWPRWSAALLRQGCQRMRPELPIVPAAVRRLDTIAVLTWPLLLAALIRRQKPSWRRQGRPAGCWLKFPEADRPRGRAGAGGCACTSPRTRHPRRPTAAGTATGYRLAAR